MCNTNVCLKQGTHNQKHKPLKKLRGPLRLSKQRQMKGKNTHATINKQTEGNGVYLEYKTDEVPLLSSLADWRNDINGNKLPHLSSKKFIESKFFGGVWGGGL